MDHSVEDGCVVFLDYWVGGDEGDFVDLVLLADGIVDLVFGAAVDLAGEGVLDCVMAGDGEVLLFDYFFVFDCVDNFGSGFNDI